MACIGTFQWAINEVDRIEKRFNLYAERAEAHDCTIRHEVGHENAEDHDERGSAAAAEKGLAFHEKVSLE